MKTVLKNLIQFAFFVLLVVSVLDLVGFAPTPYHFVPIRSVLINN